MWLWKRIERIKCREKKKGGYTEKERYLHVAQEEKKNHELDTLQGEYMHTSNYRDGNRREKRKRRK